MRASFGEQKACGHLPARPRRFLVLAERLLQRRKGPALVHVVAADTHAMEVEARGDGLIGIGVELHRA